MNLQKSLLASTMLLTLAGFVTSANAQTETTTEKKEEASEVVVTGSRIRKSTITSSSPIQVITSEQSSLLGLSNATEILQSTPAASTASQVTNNYTGFITTGGPGVNTLNLRGLGASRTLVILNGKRVGPAGVRGQVGPFDLNTIPGALVSRYDVMLDGASSIYGSEAIAGVVNVITKKNYSGGSFYINANTPEQSGGESYNIALTQGIVKDRFHGQFALEYYKQNPLTLADRTWSQCPQDYVFDATTGVRQDLIDPKTGTYKCNILLNARVDNLSTGRLYVYDDAAVAGGGYAADDLKGLHRVSATYTGTNAAALTRLSRQDAPLSDPKFLDRTVFSPVTRSTFSSFLGYDLTDNTEVYGEFLYNKRESSQFSFRQLFPQVSSTNPNNLFRVGNPNGYAAGVGRPIIAIPSYNRQEVNYMRGMAGIKGILPDFGPIKGWTWDVYAQFSQSDATYGNNFVYNDRVLATTAAGTVCNTALLTTATACPTGGVQWFRRSTVETGVFTPEESAFLFGYEEGTTLYEQKYIEADFSGDLMDLPAGKLGAAVGFVYRTESIDDQPGKQAATSNLWGSTSAGRTKGDDTVKEAYLELSIPLLKGLPLIEKMNIDASTRYSEYDSYGESSTYKIGLDWALTKWLRLRASQGDSFRAPALYELYLANQSGFLGQSSIDPCYQWGSDTTPNPTVNANCAAQGIPGTYSAAGSSSATIFTGGGKGILSAETGLNKTIGLVFTPSFIKLEAAVDFYETKIENQVAQFGAANILYQCYASPNLSSPFCTLFKRDLTPGSTTLYNILTVQNSYTNVAEQFQRGIDLNINYRHDFKWFKFALESSHSFVLDWNYRLLDGSPTQDYLIYVGYPHYAGEATFRFDKGDYTLNWGVKAVGKSSEDKYWGTNVFNYLPSTPTYYKQYTEFYTTHTVSLRKKFDKWSVTGTISNVFDEAPPFVSTGVTSSRLATAPLTSQYDLLGRSFRFQFARNW